MRIRIVRAPTQPCIDGVRLDQFRVGCEYDLGTTLAGVMLAEGWAEPVDGDVQREFFAISDGPLPIAADRQKPKPPR